MTDTNEPNEPKKPRKPRKPAEPKLPAVLTPEQHTLKLMEIAVQRGASSEEINALMAMRRELQAEYAASRFIEAKSRFLSALPIIKKLKMAKITPKNGGPAYVYWYAGLEDIVETIKPYLEPNGLAFKWREEITPFENTAKVTVTCTLTHRDGHSDECQMSGMLDQSGGKNPIQMLASTSTYLRRYTLTGVAGIATADQDIDGRLPETINGSATLDAILTEGSEEADLISDEMMAANNIQELNLAGAKIKEFPDGAFKQRLQKEYFDIRKMMEEDRG